MSEQIRYIIQKGTSFLTWGLEANYRLPRTGIIAIYTILHVVVEHMIAYLAISRYHVIIYATKMVENKSTIN